MKRHVYPYLKNKIYDRFMIKYPTNMCVMLNINSIK